MSIQRCNESGVIIMEVSEVKEQLSKLQDEFLTKINKFEKKTGVYVSDIYVMRYNTVNEPRTVVNVDIRTSIEVRD